MMTATAILFDNGHNSVGDDVIDEEEEKDDKKDDP